MVQQRAFLLGLAAPPRGSEAAKTGLVQSFPKQNANPSISGLTGTLKRGSILLQDLLTGLCSHDSQSLCLNSQGFSAVGGFGRFSNLYSKSPLLV